jgi:hypothetical protein
MPSAPGARTFDTYRVEKSPGYLAMSPMRLLGHRAFSGIPLIISIHTSDPIMIMTQ